MHLWVDFRVIFGRIPVFQAFCRQKYAICADNCFSLFFADPGFNKGGGWIFLRNFFPPTWGKCQQGDCECALFFWKIKGKFPVDLIVLGAPVVCLSTTSQSEESKYLHQYSYNRLLMETDWTFISQTLSGIYILSNTLSLIFWDNFFLHILCFYSRQSRPIWWKCVKTWNMKIWDGKSDISAIR